MMGVDSVMDSTTNLVQSKDVRMDKPAELRERTNQVYSAVIFLVFSGYLDPKTGDIKPYLDVDAVEYYLSQAYTALIEKDYKRYDEAIGIAESIVSRVEKQIMSDVEKLKQKNSF